MSNSLNTVATDLLSLNNKSVLITGAASGFGLLLAQSMASLGAKLVLGDINKQGLEQLVTQLKAENKKVQLIAQHCDVSQEEDCQELVHAASNTFGQLDIAINNAGIVQSLIAFHELSEAEFDKQFSINVKGVFFGMKHQIIQMMTQRGGIILNTSSLAGIGGARLSSRLTAQPSME